MSLIRSFASISTVGTIVLHMVLASAQTYPDKPIRIVTSAAGSSTDFIARLMAPTLANGLTQPIVVENRSGAVIPGQTIAQATPDGYTLLVAGPALWVGPLLQKMLYNPKEFVPISLLVTQPYVLVEGTSVPAKSVQELIALAKAKPGALNFGTTAPGGVTYLSGEMFKSMARINIVSVPYNGTEPALTAVVGGEVQLTFGNPTQVAPHIATGKLRALAVTSARPSALFPGLPTVAASGLPGFESANMSVMLAPARTPEPIISRLNQEVVRAVTKSDVKDKVFSGGAEVIGSSPAELAAALDADIGRMSELIKEIGLRTGQ